MSITRLQQARQMYAMGQRVAKTLDGSRPGYGGGADMGTKSGTSRSANTGLSGGYQGGPKGGTGPTGRGEGEGANKRPTVVTADNIDNITLTGKDYEKARKDFQMGISRVGPFDNRTGYTGPAYQPLTQFGYTQYPYQNFLDYKPEINIPNFGFLGMAANLAKKPIQKFADFTTEKNRKYFMDEVVRAGRIPGLDFGTVRDMSGEELEAAYKSYLSDRLNNKTDAYGNPNPGYDGGGGGGAIEGIATLYNNNMFDDTEENDPFVFRYAGEDSTLNPGAAGLNSVAELRDLQLERAKNIYT